MHVSLRRVATAVVAPFLVVGVLTTAASAAAATRWVSTAPIGANKNCASPGYNSIGSAIAASASGDIIRVCGGTYVEQVTIDRSVKIAGAGAGAVTITNPFPAADSSCNPSPAGLHVKDVVEVCGGSGVAATLSGVTVRGNFPEPGGGDCTLQPYGVAVVTGSQLALTDSTVTKIRQDPLNGCQGGVGVLAGRSSTAQTGVVSLNRVAVSDYQKGGVVVSNIGSVATITSSTITGVGATPQIASNGLQASQGGKLVGNNLTVTGNECDVTPACGPDVFNNTQAAGVLLLDPASGSVVKNSAIAGNDMGVYSCNVQCIGSFATPAPPPLLSGNSLTNRYAGIEMDQGSTSVSKNTISGGEVGIAIFTYSGQGAASAGTVSGNTISNASQAGVEVFDDGSGPATAVVFNKNTVNTNNAKGVVNQGTRVFNAKSNWWGDASGPSDWSIGSGATVDPNVDFFPWATSATFGGYQKCTHSGSGTFNDSVNAVLCGTTHNDSITESGTGRALLIGAGGQDNLTGGSNDDALIGNPSADVLDGGGGSDHVQCRGGADTVSNAEFTNNC